MGEMAFNRLIAITRVGMNDNFRQGRELMKQTMADLFGYEMALLGRLLAVHFNVQFAVQAMSQPANCCSMHIHDAQYMRNCVAKVLIGIRIHRSHDAMPYILRRFSDNPGNGCANGRPIIGSGREYPNDTPIAPPARPLT